MKSYFERLRIGFWVAAAVMAGGIATARAGEAGKNLPLVFDPQTKKYFIGGTSKFVLKQGEQSSLIDRIEISIDGGEYRPYSEAVEFKEEGKHTLKFRAVNPVNNWSPVQFVEVFVDLTAPTTEAKFLDDKFFKNDTGLYVGMKSTVSLVSQDNLSGIASVEYSWDGATFSPYVKPIEIEKSGKQTLFYRSTDKVGNSEVAKRVDFIADNASPNSVLQLVGQLPGMVVKPAVIGGKSYVSDSVAFSIRADDDSSKVKQTWVVVDGKPQIYLKPVYFLQEGAHTLGYYSVDNVGNKEDVKTVSIYTVSAPPKTSIIPVGRVVNTGGINYAKRDFQVKLEARDNIVGLDRIEYKADQDAEFRPYLEPIRFTSTGFHTLSYRSVDRAGNVEPARTYTVNVLEAAPETTIATAQPLIIREGVTYSPAPNVITFNVSNSPVGVKQTLVSINDGPFTPYQGPMTLGADKKVYKIFYKSVDKLENEETPKAITFNMIGTIPVVDMFISNGRSSEEQVRTNYLEQPSSSRGLSSSEKDEPAAPASAKKTGKKK